MAGRRLRTVFFGSSEFAVPSLARMLERHEVVAVCTQPDKPAGRGIALTPTPVALAASQGGLAVLKPQRLDAEFIRRIADVRPELLACASYGKILPRALLELEGMAALNVHPSLLPRYRGATPIQAALRDGQETTGVTVFWMTQRMDAGDIALAREQMIRPSDNYGTLHDALANLGAELLAEAATALSEGRLPRVPQREEDATYCKPLSKEDLRLRFDVPARAVVDQVRSLSPRPGAWMLFEGKRLKVLEAQVLTQAEHTGNAPGQDAAPGTLVANDDTGPTIAAAAGSVRLLRVIPEGKPPMSGGEFAQRSTSRRT